MPVPYLFWIGHRAVDEVVTPPSPPSPIPPPGTPGTPVTVDAESFDGNGFIPFCDRCGFVYRLKDLQEDWQGLLLCQPCYEPRHIADFIPARIPFDGPRADNIKREIFTKYAGPQLYNFGGSFDSAIFDTDIFSSSTTAASIDPNVGVQQ